MTEISFEFFPPRTPEGLRTLVRNGLTLARHGPAWYSVTYGAGGSTRDGTLDTVTALREAGMDAAPHVSWGGDAEDDIVGLVERYLALGVDRFVVLRGDRPAGDGGSWRPHYAEELVSLIRRRVARPLELAVAAYPEVHPDAVSADADIEFLKRKVDAGANVCVTQYFYNADGYFHFVDRCAAAGIDAPVVAGVMPITGYGNLVRFSDKCGAEIPRWIRQRLEGLDGDQEGLLAFGEEVVTALCQRLLDGGVPGIHFYTLNRARPTRAILGNLGL